MKTPPYNQIYGIAKHGTDEALCDKRNEIRWLASWINEIQGTMRVLVSGSTICASSEKWDEDTGAMVRSVTLTAKLTNEELQNLLLLLSAEDDE
jgi:hypothetical protein